MPNKFKPMKSRFRATFSGGDLSGAFADVDKEAEILRGVQITLEGEAKGHGVWLDREFCEAVAEAGNATGDVGVKVRYGHPSMCSDAIGTELGRAKNFRVVDVDREIDGETLTVAGVVADVYLLKSAHEAPQGDIAAHVLAVAAEDPKQFGQSIVFTYADWVVKDADGNRHSYHEEVEEGELSYGGWLDQSADGHVYAVLGKLHGTDFTDTPAATDGIFSTGTLAEEAEQMLEEHPQILEVLKSKPESVVQFLERTGLLEYVETKRTAGLQAAKDKTIAELREMNGVAADANVALRDEKSAVEAALGEANGRIEAVAAALDCEPSANFAEVIGILKSDADEKTATLGDLQKDVERLTAKLAETETALSDAKAALEVEKERYRAQVGAALGQPGTGKRSLDDVALAEGVKVVG